MPGGSDPEAIPKLEFGAELTEKPSDHPPWPTSTVRPEGAAVHPGATGFTWMPQPPEIDDEVPLLPYSVAVTVPPKLPS